MDYFKVFTEFVTILFPLLCFGFLAPKHVGSGASQVVLVVKHLPANEGDARDADSIPRSGRSPGVGSDNLLQYSCLENSMGRAAWWATIHWAAKNMTQLNDSAQHMSYLSTPTRDWTCSPWIGRQSLNHWTAREVCFLEYLKKYLIKMVHIKNFNKNKNLSEMLFHPQIPQKTSLAEKNFIFKHHYNVITILNKINNSSFISSNTWIQSNVPGGLKQALFLCVILM